MELTQAMEQGELRDKLVGMGINSVAELATKYENAQTAISSSIRIPAEGATKEERDAAFAQLGCPASAEDYNIPESSDSVFSSLATNLRSKAKELNITKDQFEGLMGEAQGKLSDHSVETSKKLEEAQLRWIAESKAKHGDQFDTMLAKAKRAWDGITSNDPVLNQIMEDTGMGNHPKVLDMLTRVAELTGDDMVPGSEDEQRPTGGNIEEGKKIALRIRQIAADKEMKGIGVDKDALMHEYYELQEKLEKMGFEDGVYDPRLTSNPYGL